MSEAPVSFSKAANPETEIGVDLCILVNGGKIKLDMALQKDAPRTKEFLEAVDLLDDKARAGTFMPSKAARPGTEIGIVVHVHTSLGRTKLDMALQQDAPATQYFMGTVAVLLGLNQPAE
jgi:hypothetical protein